MSLVACPFCREMFEEGERQTCPYCDVRLTDFAKLPPSADAALEDDLLPVEPQHEPLARSDLRRGKGAILALGVVGLALFFLPWVWLTMPQVQHFSGFDLARRVGWAWGAAVSWVVLIPTVLSRKSIAQLWGARVAAVFLSSVPAVTVGDLLLRPPHGTLVHVRLEWGWPMYATVVVSLASAAVSLRLGGRVDDLTVPRGSSAGETLN